MKVRIWGCRGSLPVSGADYLKYGGNTTCIEVTLSDGTTVIFDAGTGGYLPAGFFRCRAGHDVHEITILLPPNWNICHSTAWHKSPTRGCLS